MTKIVPFPSPSLTTAQRQDAAQPMSAPRQAGVCEVIIFPGVRYERWDSKPVKQKRKPRQKQRERIEVVV
jgi:hypothetical protein